MGGDRMLLLCPHTFMNNSGTSVLAARDFYKLENADLLIVCDDFSLPAGKLRMRSKGSAGGQKGLEDIIRVLGGDVVSRLRLGMGRCPRAGTRRVLCSVSSRRKKVRSWTRQWFAPQIAVADWVAKGIEYCMNTYN